MNKRIIIYHFLFVNIKMSKIDLAFIDFIDKYIDNLIYEYNVLINNNQPLDNFRYKVLYFNELNYNEKEKYFNNQTMINQINKIFDKLQYLIDELNEEYYDY